MAVKFRVAKAQFIIDIQIQVICKLIYGGVEVYEKIFVLPNNMSIPTTLHFNRLDKLPNPLIQYLISFFFINQLIKIERLGFINYFNNNVRLYYLNVKSRGLTLISILMLPVRINLKGIKKLTFENTIPFDISMVNGLIKSQIRRSY